LSLLKITDFLNYSFEKQTLKNVYFSFKSARLSHFALMNFEEAGRSFFQDQRKIVVFDMQELSLEDLERLLLNYSFFPTPEMFIFKNAEKASSEVIDFFKRYFSGEEHVSDRFLVFFGMGLTGGKSFLAPTFVADFAAWENKDFVFDFFRDDSLVKEIFKGKFDFLPKDIFELYTLCRDLSKVLRQGPKEERQESGEKFLGERLFHTAELPVFQWLDQWVSTRQMRPVLQTLFHYTQGDPGKMLRGLSFFQNFLGRTLEPHTESKKLSSFERKIENARQDFAPVQILLWSETLELLLSLIKRDGDTFCEWSRSYIEWQNQFNKNRDEMGHLREWNGSLKEKLWAQ
jgi:hypothetical protein